MIMNNNNEFVNIRENEIIIKREFTGNCLFNNNYYPPMMMCVNKKCK